MVVGLSTSVKKKINARLASQGKKKINFGGLATGGSTASTRKTSSSSTAKAKRQTKSSTTKAKSSSKKASSKSNFKVDLSFLTPNTSFKGKSALLSGKKVGVQDPKKTGNFNNGLQLPKGLKLNPKFTKGATTGTLKFTTEPPTKQPNTTKLPFFLTPNFNITKDEARQSANQKFVKPSVLFGKSSEGAPSIFDDPNVRKANQLGDESFSSPTLPPLPPDSTGGSPPPLAGQDPNPIQEAFDFFTDLFSGFGGSSSSPTPETPVKEVGDISIDFNPVSIDDTPEDAPELEGAEGFGSFGGSDESDGDESEGGFLQSITKDPVVFGVGAVSVIALMAGILSKR